MNKINTVQIYGMIRRFFHVSRMSMASTADLVKLRKSTGYTVSNCKKALEMFPDDIAQAEEWLHSQAKSKGWSKMEQIQSRTAAQGLIGVYSDNNIGVMVEVNCETDFVAKNVEFQQFVTNILSGCLNHAADLPADEDLKKVTLESTQLNALKYGQSTVGDLVATAISKFSEKTVAKRAVCLKVNDKILLSSLTHPSIACSNLSGALLGKYGTLLAYKKKAETLDNTSAIGTDICQHIIGMNPSSIGDLSEADIDKFLRKEKSKDTAPSTEAQTEENAIVNSEESSEVSSEQGTVDSTLQDTDETQLVHQPFLLDSSVTVGETLYKSELEVIDFERFECGECEQQQNVVEAVAVQ